MPDGAYVYDLDPTETQPVPDWLKEKLEQCKTKIDQVKAEGRKDDADKLRLDLLPVRPMFAVGHVYTMGAKKYSDRNWELGLKWSRVFGAMLRHSWKWWSGEKFDPEDGQHHLASVVWCALALMEYEYTHPELDDRVKTGY